MSGIQRLRNRSRGSVALEYVVVTVTVTMPLIFGMLNIVRTLNINVQFAREILRIDPSN